MLNHDKPLYKENFKMVWFQALVQAYTTILGDITLLLVKSFYL